MGLRSSKNAKRQKPPEDVPTKSGIPAHDLKVEEADEIAAPAPDATLSPSHSMAGARETHVTRARPPPIDVAAPERTLSIASRTEQAGPFPGSPMKEGQYPGSPMSQGPYLGSPTSPGFYPGSPTTDQAMAAVVLEAEVRTSPSTVRSGSSRRLQDYPRSSDRNLCQVYRLCKEYEHMGHGQRRPDHHMRGIDFLVSKNSIVSEAPRDPKRATTLWAKAKASVPLHTWKGLARQARILKYLRESKFFSQLENQTPGLLKKLSEVARTVHEDGGQVLFRQGDQAQSCFLLMHGEVGIFSLAKERLKQADKSSPRQSKLKLSQLPTLTDAPKEQKDQYKSMQGRKLSGKDPRIFDRFKTTEGFHSFSANSFIGKQTSKLCSGDVVGEGALDREKKRKETMKCILNCEFAVIDKQEYAEIYRTTIQKVKFFRQNIPCCGHDHGFDVHPATHFSDGSFLEGHTFLTEGVSAEARLFVILEGTVEFRRCEDPHDDPAAKYQTLTLSRSQPYSRSDRPVLTWDALAEGKMFCTLAAFPIQAYEPFSVIATSDCKVYYATATQIANMPERFIRACRHFMMQDMLVRLLRMQAHLPDAFVPPDDTHPLKSRQQGAWTESGTASPTARSSRLTSPTPSASSSRSPNRMRVTA
mmetsp:Transcript_87599/g.165125  ORF Transcript_87599/g.165125 Transcript_87599/m.165125 type:complete len:643 (-) Transcript_87599:109-2037(-)